ncbi:hypothetical protein ASE61_14945 [Bosea sp. Root670]|uniref:hypothetical protein n=1 Tax=Bosea sp. Root670 TaxID=1736583 RepID=UPI000716402C|nr:hypothetical protein [Bosea sp. Root670]KRE02574.1 hypothetical protein ASE61_14945 [Bosea sp. Root670]
MISQTVAARRPAAALRSVPARMADFLSSHSASAGGVTEEDLLLDFTKDEIAEHLEKAKQIARNNGKVRQ